MNDQQFCEALTDVLANVFPEIDIVGGGEEPFYEAPKGNLKGRLIFRETFPRSLLHELSHFCLAGSKRRQEDDFGYWYVPSGRSESEQVRFEEAEARPQGLEKLMCEIVGLKFSPSFDNDSVSPVSAKFAEKLEAAYQEMKTNPPATAKKALQGLARLNLTVDLNKKETAHE